MRRSVKNWSLTAFQSIQDDENSKVRYEVYKACRIGRADGAEKIGANIIVIEQTV